MGLFDSFFTPKVIYPDEYLLARDEMDVLGDLFAFRYVGETQVEMFSTENGQYRKLAVFDRQWLGDLVDTAVEAATECEALHKYNQETP